ncbi:MAG TPA: lasso peptide biosynthesis B2 protein [Patescibacteria group bacterium]|nr:lasso peptide biosynthesis B2 protein [Patescibacteria group bacterium]
MTIEAAAALALARLTFGLLPFPTALRLFGLSVTAAGCVEQDVAVAKLVGRAVERAARHVPFRAVCLQQAMAAALMLRRRGLAATVYLGTMRDGAGGLAAHAWSLCGDAPVTGVRLATGYVPVAKFAV